MAERKKILLAQLFSNGDCLYATAIARQIKHDFPGCHLTWAIVTFCKGVLTANPYVDEVMEVTNVIKSDIITYRQFKKQMLAKKEQGEFDEIFFTTNMDDNQAYYDGCIRTNILNAYPNKITEGIQPVLQFTNEEKNKVEAWVKQKELDSYKHVVLFEFAPQSGQLNINTAMALNIAQELSARGDAAVILSSAQKIDESQKGIMDGSALSFRESVYLSNFCTMLLGCSSGITWGTTSDGGKLLPMVQLLNPWTAWVNPISRDFERQGIATSHVIELIDFDEQRILNVVAGIFENGFSATKEKYNQPIPLHFKTSRRIVYNMLCYAQFGAVKKHWDVNVKVYGYHTLLIKAFAFAILGFPLIFISNKIRKAKKL